MAIAIDEVKKQGAIAEACICYTGNLASATETKYTLQYYLKIAKELAAMGSDIICIKDMAGLLRPQAARILIKALRDTIDLPIHLHTHDTSGNGVAMLLEAARAGCHIVDGAVSSLSGLTSQPSLNALVASMEGEPLCPAVSLPVLDELGRYWEGVRTMYQAFDPGIKATSTRVYDHEIPGGQYSNLYDQARNVGVTAEEFYALTDRYREVNQLFGNIVKVTPSSKVVGDFALLLQKHKLTGPAFLEKRPALDYPDSVVSFFKGHMGVPYGGFPQDVRKLILGDQAGAPEKPPIEKTGTKAEVQVRLKGLMGSDPTERDVLSYVMYPKVFLDFISHQQTYGQVDALPTPVYFYGLKNEEEIEVDIARGKTLVISLAGVGEADAKGIRTVFFNLNGYPREVRILDASAKGAASSFKKADAMNPFHIGAPMPGKVLDVKAKKGDRVKRGQALLVTESMKMEYVIAAKQDGLVGEVQVRTGDMVESGDLLIEVT